MSIFPLPIFERDEDPAHRDAMTDAEIYARLKAPTSIVVKFGSIKLIGEYPYDGSAKPGCGSRLVVKTHRGTEVAEMLTTTCPNSGCSKSISRREMLEYVENSGGKEYPFHTNGRVLRVATIEDLNAWSATRERFGREELDAVRAEAKSMGFTMKIVEVEPVLGGEHVTVHYLSEERVDFRELVPALARRFGARVEMHQIGARDEARLTADHLVGANLAGHDSHGVGMAPRYVKSWRAGELMLNRKVEIVLDNGPMVTIDGMRGMGQSVTAQAMG